MNGSRPGRSLWRGAVLGLGATLGILCILATVGAFAFGVTPLVFRSGSMAPTIPTGALALAERVPASQVRVGQVVSVLNSAGVRITHRVVSIDRSGSGATLTLKGDANAAPDQETYPVTSVGRVRGSVPRLGYAVSAASSPWGMLAGGALVASTFFLAFRRDGQEERDDRHDGDQGHRGDRSERVNGRVRSGSLPPAGRPMARHRAGAALLATTLVGLGAVVAPITPTLAAFSDTATATSAGITANQYFTCDSGIKTAVSPYLYWKLDETGTSTTAVDSSGNNRPGAYRQTTSGSENVSTGGTTRGAARACRRDSGTAVRFDGSTGYASAAATAPPTNTFSLSLWFKTAKNYARGGKLIGYGNQQSGASGQYDRHVYMTDSGQLVFGVYVAGTKTVTSPASTPYNDGAWHQVVATLSSAGMALYVDGDPVAKDPGTTTAEGYTGYWRIAFDNLSGWPSRPDQRLLRRDSR